MTTANITYASTKPAWKFWLETGLWLGGGLTIGVLSALGVIIVVGDLLDWLVGWLAGLVS